MGEIRFKQWQDYYKVGDIETVSQHFRRLREENPSDELWSAFQDVIKHEVMKARRHGISHY